MGVTHTTTTLDMGACRPFVDDSTLKPGIVLTKLPCCNDRVRFSLGLPVCFFFFFFYYREVRSGGGGFRGTIWWC